MLNRFSWIDVGGMRLERPSMSLSTVSVHIKLWIQVWQGALRQSLNLATPRRLTVEMIEGLGGQQGLRAIGVHQL
jgi:hypothetical protein